MDNTTTYPIPIPTENRCITNHNTNILEELQKKVADLEARLAYFERNGRKTTFAAHKKTVCELLAAKDSLSVTEIMDLIGCARPNALALMKNIAVEDAGFLFLCGDFGTQSLLVKAGEATIDLQLYSGVLKQSRRSQVFSYLGLRELFEKAGANDVSEARVQSLVSRLVASRKFNILFQSGKMPFWQRSIKRVK